jgi:hypothetical protein
MYGSDILVTVGRVGRRDEAGLFDFELVAIFYLTQRLGSGRHFFGVGPRDSRLQNPWP